MHTIAMLVRGMAVLALVAVTILPGATEAFALRNAPRASFVRIARPAPLLMSVAERLNDNSFCYRTPSPVAALPSHTIADVPPVTRGPRFVVRTASAGTTDQTDISYAPELPAANRIRAPSV